MELYFFLPPKFEQKKILESIYDFENKAMVLDKEIKSQIDLIDELHKKTLEDAFSGLLTENYRLENYENFTGLELLKSLQRKKKLLIAKKEIPKENSFFKMQSSEFPYSIPKSWTWCRMSDIAVKLGAGSTPKGGRAVYVKNGIKFFRSMNIYNDGIRIDDIAYIDDVTHQRMKGTHVKPNDILLNITGGSIGRCALVPPDFDTGNVSQHVAIIRLMDSQMVEYIHFLITSPYFQETIMNVQVGVSREGLSMSSLKMIKIPLPPINEILVIAKLIKDFEVVKDKLKEVVDKSREDFNLMKRNILKEAFGNINLEINNMAKSKSLNEKGTFHPNLIGSLRDYTKDPSLQELEQLLAKNGKMSALALWKMSKYENDIDGFYENLKEKVEVEKIIIESDEKGFLELAI
ncbi:EcoKI restriction-modification system protein HsdS [compost metagenome]